ncbi:DNRLRE domain-containing protein [Caloramator sp. CAR-1]|uniref:DNRLRE domain-containing protein n=1 Tax=Caloramator sp. CAR-1 TaxID=3062777 RepID=UPI0026E36B1A|nr:DNRLRE domain-containing protein [Caloramator sp. CAR-1]MDO6355966.1 DNRLRE domain-containing protein [Caloramator sp. CAR-1]
MHQLKRRISFILIFTLILSFINIKVFADIFNSSFAVEDAPKVKEIPKKEAKIIKEVEEKREKNIKHFLKDDFTYEAAIYPTAVHYLKDGKWKDIDNSLIQAKDEDNLDILENKENSYKIKIAKNTNSEKLVRIQKDNYEISWNIESPLKSTALIENIDSNYINSLSNNEKFKFLPNVKSTVSFKEVLPNVDLKYDILPEELKESIILSKKVENPIFNFNIKTKNLLARLEEGEIIFYDKDNVSNKVFYIDKAFMYDANGEESKDIEIEFIETKEGYKLTIKPSKQWLDDEKRAYPVVIDPTIGTSLDPSDIYDAHVSSGYPNTNYMQSVMLKVGYGSSSGVNRTYIKFNLPTLTSADLITKGELNLFLYTANSTARQINVHKVLSDWNSSSITWSNKPGYNTTIEDYQLVQGSIGNKFTFDITSIVKDWYTTGNNYGLMLKNEDETIGYNEFFSSDISGTYEIYRPKVTLSYVNNSGLEDYWTYHSHDVGRAGTGYINDYNGNLIFIHQDLSMNGNRLPISIYHVYNTNEKDSDIKYGLGWRLNLSQRITSENIDGKTYYVYTDEDGTKHYFLQTQNTNEYPDESGLNLKLIKNADGTYTINDKKGNQLIFTAGGYLRYIKDNNGNTITLSYQGTVLKTIADPAGRIVILETTDAGYLTGILDSAGRRTSFQYTGTKLTKITYPDGNYTTYSYDSQNRLISAQNFDGYKMSYTYYAGAGSKIYEVIETSAGGAQGNKLTIEYGFNKTKFKDIGNREIIYQFNDSGNTVSIRDNKGYAKYFKYNSTGATKNKLSLESKLQRTVLNYLQNHNAEASSYFTLGNWTGSTGSGSFATNEKYFGKQSIKISKTNNISRHFYGQTLTLTKGRTYTLSGYVKTENITNTNGKGAAVFVNYQDNTGVWKTADSRYINGTNDWQRVEVTFTIPSDAASSTVYARFGIVEESGDAYFDALQLEDGFVANRYNLVENADFLYGTDTPTFWTKNSYLNSDDTKVTSTPAPGLDSNLFRIFGEATKTKALYQKIYVEGKEGDTFVVSGWAKANSVPISQGRYFAIDIGFEKVTGGYEYQVIPFNQDSNDWQYISDRIVAGSDYKSINIYVLYYNNENIAWFDGLGLYKEEFGDRFEYDTNGNLSKIIDVENNQTNLTYENNDVTNYIDPKGNSSSFSYDEKHNLTGGTSSEGTLQNYSYDGFGNVTESKIGTDTNYIKTTATYEENFNYLKTQTDASGNTVSYNFDTAKGVLNSVTDAKNSTTNYVYDILDRMTEVKMALNENDEVKNTYTYVNDRLSAIGHNGFSYSFIYDALGRNTGVKVGSQSLITNTYDAYSRIESSTYGNGQTISYNYDDLDRITAKKYNGIERFKYEYDASGNLGYLDDLVNGVKYRYVYDISDRLIKIEDSNGNRINYSYDSNSNRSSVVERINGLNFTTSYSYDKDNREKEVTLPNGAKAINNYDNLGRLNNKVILTGSASFITNYSYEAGKEQNSTTNRLSEIDNNGKKINYTYDANGNIETITRDGKRIKYYYNELNEVYREDNQILNKTILYTYDLGGNILSKVEYPYTEGLPENPTKTITYTYNDSNWKDKLTSFDGKTITYDAIGNPLSYDGYSFTWEEGRQLARIQGNGFNISYKYNDQGIRTEKTINGVTTKYYLLGDKVILETNGTDTIHYSYDTQDNLVSMNLNNVEYYYVRNGQGDVIALIDSNGNEVVTYTYDSWGNIISIDGILKDTAGIKNPYRYRGYRYDEETKLYYLQSRYYNPEWGRFVNADAIVGITGELLSHNMFAYCNNDPVNMEDPNGYFGIKSSINKLNHAALYVYTFVISRLYVIQQRFSSVKESIGLTFNKITNKNSVLKKASEAAFKAAKKVDDFTVSNKHLMDAGGRWQKFATNNKI